MPKTPLGWIITAIVFGSFLMFVGNNAELWREMVAWGSNAFWNKALPPIYQYIFGPIIVAGLVGGIPILLAVVAYKAWRNRPPPRLHHDPPYRRDEHRRLETPEREKESWE